MQVLQLQVKSTPGKTQVLVFAGNRLTSKIVSEPNSKKVLKQTPKK